MQANQRPIAFLLLFSLSWLAADGVWSAPPPAAPDPFAAVEDADPMELARLVDRLGDRALLERLQPDRPVEVKLAALGAAPWMKTPESVLPILATILVGRDSELAPAAARAATRIASQFDADELRSREADLREISAARAALASAGENQLLRADIRLNALQAAEALKVASGPSRL